MLGRAARVLIVEDDWFYAQNAVAAVEESGSVVIGPFPSVLDAEEILSSSGADAALLDIDVLDGTTFELARKLIAAQVPVVFHSDWSVDRMPADLCDIPIVSKWKGPSAAVASLQLRLKG